MPTRARSERGRKPRLPRASARRRTRCGGKVSSVVDPPHYVSPSSLWKESPEHFSPGQADLRKYLNDGSPHPCFLLLLQSCVIELALTLPSENREERVGNWRNFNSVAKAKKVKKAKKNLHVLG